MDRKTRRGGLMSAKSPCAALWMSSHAVRKKFGLMARKAASLSWFWGSPGPNAGRPSTWFS
jgi:hypothetical protein